MATVSDKLLAAIVQGSTEKVKELIETGVNMHLRFGESKTFLHFASSDGHHEIVELLLKAGANIHARDKYGAIPLYYAAAEGHHLVVDQLLKAGADPTTLTLYGETAFSIAKEFRHESVLIVLLTYWHSRAMESRVLKFNTMMLGASDPSSAVYCLPNEMWFALYQQLMALPLTHEERADAVNYYVNKSTTKVSDIDWWYENEYDSESD